MSSSDYILYLFIKFSFLIALIPIWIGGKYYRYLTNITRYIWIISLISFGMDILGRGLIYLQISNAFNGYIYAVLEFLLITLIYQEEFKNYLPKYTLHIIFILFLGFSVIDILLIQGAYIDTSYHKFVECTISIAYVLIHFFKIFQELKIAHLEREPIFWFSAGLLLYFSGAIFIFIFSNYLLTYSLKLSIKVWTVHAFFLILFHLMNTIAIWHSPRKQNLLYS